MTSLIVGIANLVVGISMLEYESKFARFIMGANFMFAGANLLIAASQIK